MAVRGRAKRGPPRVRPRPHSEEEPTQIYVEHIGIDAKEYYFVEKPDQDLCCPITLEILLEPHQTDCCGQHISEKATNRILKDGRPCPICKDDNFTTHRDQYFKRNTINKLRVYCLHKKSGCEWTGELGDLNNHSTSCPKRPWKCQYCEFESTYECGTSEHTPNCDHYPLPCPNQCEIGTIPRCDIEEHLLVCPLWLVECEFANAGCEVKVPREDLARHLTENALQHLMSATLLNLQLTRELHQKMEEKDEQITELQEQVKNLDKKIEKQAKRVNTCVQDLQAKCEQQSEEVKVQGKKQAKEIGENLKNFQEEFAELDTLGDSVLLLSGFSSHEITLSEFSKHRARGEDGSWYSDPFFNAPGEYCFRLNLDTNGHHSAHGTHFSAFLFNDKTDNDTELDWPIKCTVYLQMLNQLGDYDHCIRRRAMKFEQTGNCVGHIGHSFKFFSLNGLDYRHSDNGGTQYLYDDCLKFVLHLKVDNLL